MQEQQENSLTSPDENINDEIILWLCFEKLSLRDLPKIRKSIQNSINDVLELEQKYIDAFMLAVTEILSNLIKYGKENISYISITLYTKEIDSKKSLILKVSDNGDEIADFSVKYNSSCHKVQNKIIHEDENDHGRGIGIIDNIMDNLLYISNIDSKDNLNHIIVEKYLDRLPKNIKKQPNSQKIDKKQHKIFIIDDDNILCKMLDSLLSKYYNTKVFSSALDALDKFEQEQPDLILSDLLMPEMNGAELREALSEKKNGDITPFIFLSGHPEEAKKEYVSKLGIDGFLNKSIDKKELLATIKRTIRRSQQLRNNIPEQIASDISNALKPKAPPNSKYWKFAIKSEIADTGGGDMLLYYPTNDGIMIVFADVMGHGIAAKFFAYAYMGYLRSIIRTSIKNSIEPASLLNEVSRNIYEDEFLDDCIFTCQVVLLQNDGILKVSSAGHPLPIIANPDGQCDFLEISGTLPGMLPNTRYHQEIYEMSNNDRLILYTDGIIENISRQNPEKAQNILSKNIQKYSIMELSVEKLLRQIWKTQIENFSNGFNDDTTILAIEYNNVICTGK